MDYTQSIGNITELKCMTAFIELGYECSIPYGNNAKYDFVVDVNGKFWRIQCKSSHVSHDHGKEDKDAFSFSTICQTTNTKVTRRYRYTKEDIDYFCTYYEGNVYIVPVDKVSTSKTLRFKPPKNNSSLYNKAEDYLLINYLSPNKKLIDSKENFEKRTQPTLKVNILQNKKKELKRDCINRSDLKKLVREKSFLEIGRLYNVSDKCISKWCKFHNIPHLKSEINKLSDQEWENV